ncbi:hypothetical protein N657DRAFT_680077 [Parathielavia appendiculata]|uniref:Berberine/berberine-like domain-containing protein n=1 Tax=Parathielavia appendiculata TaxID=2587402 RepID=A0AAN6U2R5_9PEZI|nr:hypothetical protein N657DRAFT_680077 [Parathielavia appendiculata]
MLGGGGSTFGVVTSIIIHVDPKLPVRLSPTSPNSYSFTIHPFFAPNHTLYSFHARTKPFFNRLKQLNIPVTPNTTLHPAFYPAYNANWGSDRVLNSAGRVSVPSNQLLPRANWADLTKFNATFAVIREYVEPGRLLMGYHQASRNRVNADNAGGRPKGAVMENPTAADLRAALGDLQRNVNTRFREVAPEREGGGAYSKETNRDEPEWQSTLYRVENYKRLLEIQRNGDLREVFYATTAVGSEGWELPTMPGCGGVGVAIPLPGGRVVVGVGVPPVTPMQT